MTRTTFVLGALAVALLLGAAVWLSLRPVEDGEDPSGPGIENLVLPENSSGIAGPNYDEETIRAILVEYTARLGGGLPADPADLLMSARTEKSGAVLLKAFEDAEDDDTRAVLLYVMAQCPDDQARELLRRAAQGEFGQGLRLVALLSLAEAGPETDLTPLKDAILGDEDPHVVGAALQALAVRHDREAWAIALEALGSTTDPDRRRLIWSALGGDALPPAPEEPSLAVRLRHERRSPMLPEHEAGEAMEGVFRAMEDEEAPAVAAFAGSAALAIPGPEASRTFARIVERADPAVRDALLGRIHPGDHPDKIAALVGSAPEHAEPEFRRRIVEMLALSEDPRLIRNLEDWRSREEDETVRARLDEEIERLNTRD